jgi:hypothetical protein
MGNVNSDGIWTPDEEDNLDPEVWSAAMADSISEGIGVRLTKQETAIGLKAGIPVATTMTDASGVIAPYQIVSGLECFTQGMTLEGGVVTVTVAGMYFISCSAALESVDNCPTNADRSIALQVFKNGGWVSGCEVKVDQGIWQTSQSNCVLNCVPGDQLSVRWYSAGTTPGVGFGTLANNGAMHTLSIVLVTPIAT